MAISTSENICRAFYLGEIPYERALKLQQRLVQARVKGNVSDSLLLLEHPSVITIGRFRGNEDLIVPQERLIQDGIAVFHSNRGGGVTYHGPGQLIGYPILKLNNNSFGVREYIWKLEEVIIRLLSTLGLHGDRFTNYPGVWIGNKKICSIGIHVTHGVTMHGFALNVNNDLRYFEYIRPCGLESEVMTSLSQLLEDPIEVKTIIGNVLNAFSVVFGFKYEQGYNEWLTTLDDPNG